MSLALILEPFECYYGLIQFSLTWICLSECIEYTTYAPQPKLVRQSGALEPGSVPVKAPL